jgi:hypothetical protein
MSLFKALGNGAGLTLRKAKLILYLWLANTVVALVAATPLFALMQKELGHSLFGRSVRTFDLLWLGEMVFKYQGLAPALVAWLVACLVVFLLLSVFLNGGVVGRLVDGEGRVNLASFLGDCGAYFWRFFRVFCVSFPFTLIALGIFQKVLSLVSGPLTENARTEWTPLIVSNLEFIALLLVLSLVHMLFDYTRILLVADKETRILRALAGAAGFVKKRVFRTWFLYLLVVAVFVCGTVFHFLVAGLLPTTDLIGLAVGLFWTQAYLVFRIWTRLLFFASEYHYYSANPF